MNRCTYELVSSPLHPGDAVLDATDTARAALDRLGAGEGAAVPCTPHAIVVGTGGTEAAVIDATESARRGCPDRPVLLIAHPQHNSLAAALESLAHLHQRGIRGRIVFVEQENDPTLAEAVDDLTVWHRLRTTRLGLIGPPSDWLVASTPSAETVAERWGPQLVDVSMPETIRTFHDVPVEVGRRVAAELDAAPAAVLPAPDHVERAARLEPALRAMIERERLDAITVRCFDFLGSIETTGCVALARLNDDDIVAGCEGDVPAALAMLWARLLLDRPGWIANPAVIRAESNQLVLAHCSIAPSMVDDLTLSTHFESGIGVGLHGRLRAHRVTLVRIGGTDLDRCWIAEADVTGSGADADLCRTQATVVVDGAETQELLDDPLGNHLVVIEGAHRSRLERWWRWAIAPPERPGG